VREHNDTHYDGEMAIMQRGANEMNTRLVVNALALAFGATFAAFTAPAIAGDSQMVVIPSKDVKGTVFKRLGLPNQTYCWEQCLEESRCTGTRWAVIAGSGSTAGQCQLISGPLSIIEPREMKTEDGQPIRVIASRKEARDPRK
jgi:hypothetical protein